MTLREALMLLEVIPKSFVYLVPTNSNNVVVHCYYKHSRFSIVKSKSTRKPLEIAGICVKCGIELLSNEEHECTYFVDVAEATIRKWLPQQASGSFIVEGKWHDVSITIQLQTEVSDNEG